jgi:hypothetical protein
MSLSLRQVLYTTLKQMSLILRLITNYFLQFQLETETIGMLIVIKIIYST